MRVGKVAVIAIALLVTAGCGSLPPKATNPSDQNACDGLSSVYTSLNKPLSNALIGKATDDDNVAIQDGATKLRSAAGIATEPLKSALNDAAKAADDAADGKVTMADAGEVSKAFETLGKEVGKQCGNAAG